jgi:hypothetical protein
MFKKMYILMCSVFIVSTCFAGENMTLTDDELDAIKKEHDLKAYRDDKKLEKKRELELNIQAIHEELGDLNEDRIEELKECRYFDTTEDKQCEESVIKKYQILFFESEQDLRELEEAYSKIKQ